MGPRQHGLCLAIYAEVTRRCQPSKRFWGHCGAIFFRQHGARFRFGEKEAFASRGDVPALQVFADGDAIDPVSGCEGADLIAAQALSDELQGLV